MTKTQETAIPFLRALIAAGRDGEEACLRLFAGRLEALGWEVEVVPYRPEDVPMVAEFAGEAALDTGERRSVIARRRGAGGGRSVIFFAHPDGEPHATANWRHDPFAGIVEDGRIHGWGVADDLAGVAAMADAAALLHESGKTLSGDIVLASTPSKRHARGVSALLHGGLRADACVYLHPAESGSGMREIKALAPGLLTFRIVVEGRMPDTSEPGHASFAHLAVNPIDKAMAVCAALARLDAERSARIRHPELDAAVGRSTNLLVSHIDAGLPHRLNRVPPHCTIGAALSFPPPETLETVQAEIVAAIDAVCAADPFLAAHRPRIVWDAGVTGAEVSTDAPLYRTAAHVIATVTGQDAEINAMHTASDIRNPMNQAGIPTIGLGPLCGDLSQNGGHDEWVDVADYLRSVQVVAGIMLAWCG
jgi:acetylornithine deacetylase